MSQQYNNTGKLASIVRFEGDRYNWKTNGAVTLVNSICKTCNSGYNYNNNDDDTNNNDDDNSNDGNDNDINNDNNHENASANNNNANDNVNNNDNDYDNDNDNANSNANNNANKNNGNNNNGNNNGDDNNNANNNNDMVMIMMIMIMVMKITITETITISLILELRRIISMKNKPGRNASLMCFNYAFGLHTQWFGIIWFTHILQGYCELGAIPCCNTSRDIVKSMGKKWTHLLNPSYPQQCISCIIICAFSRYTCFNVRCIPDNVVYFDCNITIIFLFHESVTYLYKSRLFMRHALTIPMLH